MRITKKMLLKQNETLRSWIFVLLAMCFILAITLSFQVLYVQKQSDKILNNSNEIVKILTLTEEE